jgi:hypothetical protein
VSTVAPCPGHHLARDAEEFGSSLLCMTFQYDVALQLRLDS